MVLTLVDRLAAPLADAHLAAVGELLDPDADGPIAAAAHEEHVREVERALALDDAALTQLLRRPLVLLDHVDLFDEHAPGADEHAQHLAALAALLARDDGDRVAPPDVTHGSASRWTSRGRSASRSRRRGEPVTPGPAVQGEPVNGSASRWMSRGRSASRSRRRGEPVTPGPAVRGEPVNVAVRAAAARRGEPVNVAVRAAAARRGEPVNVAARAAAARRGEPVNVAVRAAAARRVVRWSMAGRA